MSQTSNGKKISRVENLKKYFPITRGLIIQQQIGTVKALDDISYDFYEGETLGLVSESGRGKSTNGRTIFHLHRPTEGKVFYQDLELSALLDHEMRLVRRKFIPFTYLRNACIRKL